jgi:hypothetical protein
LDKKNLKIKEDMVALDEGFIGKLKYTIEPPHNTRSSIKPTK